MLVYHRESTRIAAQVQAVVAGNVPLLFSSRVEPRSSPEPSRLLKKPVRGSAVMWERGLA